jgi:hypothetical protein
VEHLSPDELSVEELFRRLRKLAESHDIAERLRTLWILTMFGEWLEQCSDAQTGYLLTIVQERMSLFSADYSVYEHAKRRLQSSSSKIKGIFRRLLK